MGQVKNSLIDILNDDEYRERQCFMDLFDPIEPDYPSWEAADDPFPNKPFIQSDERPF